MFKRYKSSGSSSFNTLQLGKCSFNLDVKAGDKEEDEVQEVRQRMAVTERRRKRRHHPLHRHRQQLAVTKFGGERRFGADVEVIGVVNIVSSLMCYKIISVVEVLIRLEEVPLGGSAYTWCHKSASKMSKLDRFLELAHVKFKCNANLCGKLKFFKVKIRAWYADYRNNSKCSVTNFKEELRILDELIDKGSYKPPDQNAHIDMPFPNSLSTDQHKDLECMVSKEEWNDSNIDTLLFSCDGMLLSWSPGLRDNFVQKARLRVRKLGEICLEVHGLERGHYENQVSD
ncbi:hypothetical protein Tco_1386640 [Tanacetum coccineum]